mmetsp:Transcript_2019/g.3581  ORF Transcript_2019/g.3581 Transcript_2019/m.3581 type:complete len:140 (+) Transcript_2019:205-624(+)
MITPVNYDKELLEKAGLQMEQSGKFGSSLQIDNLLNELSEHNEKRLRLYVMVAESSVAKHIHQAIEDNSEQIDVVGIQYILSRFLEEITYFKTLEVSMIFNKQGDISLNKLDEKVKIYKQGVYYTYFIYEHVPETAQTE